MMSSSDSFVLLKGVFMVGWYLVGVYNSVCKRRFWHVFLRLDLRFILGYQVAQSSNICLNLGNILRFPMLEKVMYMKNIVL
jgi:hypothetical protein